MNSRIRNLAIGLMVCYIALFVSLQIPQVAKSKSLNSNPANTRQVEQVFDKARGDIITADGVVIARTIPAKEGDRFSYQREYPRGELFAAVTGYFSLANGASQIERVFNNTLSGKDIPIRDQIGRAHV